MRNKQAQAGLGPGPSQGELGLAGAGCTVHKRLLCARR